MELRECPFCGAQPEQADVSEYYVECPSCGLQGPYGEKDTYESSIAAWNRRASPASAPECVTFIPDRIRKVESGFKGLFIKEAKAYKQGWNDCRAAMLAAAPTPPVSEDRWQPIATAPKDGRPVWVRGNDWGEDAGPNHYGWAYFDSGKWMWPAPVAEGGEATYLTHWMPLPKAPAMQEDKP